MGKQAYTPFSLIKREPKMAGESRRGYLVRLAEQNALDGAKELANMLNVNLTDLVQADQEAFQNALQNPIPWKVSSTSSVHKFFSSFTRVCAECLSQDEKPFIRDEWERPLSIVCATHGCLLTDYCAQCKSRLHWNRKTIRFCSCGSLIAKNENPVPKWWSSVQAAFGSDRFDGDFMSGDHDEIRQAARFLNWLGRQEREGRDAFAGGLALTSEDNLFSTEELPFIERWFEDWPESFKRAAVNLPSRSELTRQYYWKSILCFASFRAIFESIREEQSSIKAASLTNAPRKIPGVGLQTLWLWQETGILPAEPMIRSLTLRRIAMCSPEIAARLESIWNTTMALNDAAWFFGASDWLISLLAEASSVKILPSRFSAGACRVDTDEMIRVAMSILSRAVPRRWDVSPVQKTPIESLLYRVREHGGLSRYLNFVDLQGRRIYREPGASRLDSVFVESEDLDAWLAEVVATKKSHRTREPIRTRDRVLTQEASSIKAPSKGAMSPQEAWPFPPFLTPKDAS